MKIRLNHSFLDKLKSLTRIAHTEKPLGNIEVFYALYKAETDTGEIYAVAVGEDGNLSAVTLDSKKDGIELYETVSENEVGEVSFFDVADDFFYERKQTTTYCDIN